MKTILEFPNQFVKSWFDTCPDGITVMFEEARCGRRVQFSLPVTDAKVVIEAMIQKCKESEKCST